MRILPIALLFLGCASTALLAQEATLETSGASGKRLESIDRSLQQIARLTAKSDGRQTIELLLRRAELNVAESAPIVADLRRARADLEAAQGERQSNELALANLRERMESADAISRGELVEAERAVRRIEATIAASTVSIERAQARVAAVESDLARFTTERESLKARIDKLLAKEDVD